MERARQVLYYGLNRYIYHPLKQVVGQYRAERVKEFLHLRQVMERVFRAEGYPEMRPGTRERLRDVFDKDIRQLESFLDRDLSHWR